MVEVRDPFYNTWRGAASSSASRPSSRDAWTSSSAWRSHPADETGQGGSDSWSCTAAPGFDVEPGMDLPPVRRVFGDELASLEPVEASGATRITATSRRRVSAAGTRGARCGSSTGAP